MTDREHRMDLRRDGNKEFYLGDVYLKGTLDS